MRSAHHHRGHLPSHAVAARFCDFLKARPDIAPPVPPGFLIRLPPRDADDCMTVAPAPEEDDLELEAKTGFATNQSITIVYDEVDGHESVRRVTVRDISLNSTGVPVLNSWCHERNALRAFRSDRIAMIITEDGEVIAPPARFFSGSFGMAEVFTGPCGVTPVPLTRIRQTFTPHMMALARLCHNDSGFSRDEQGIIFEHCLKLARDADRPINEGEKRTLKQFLKTLKPIKLFLGPAMRALQEDRPERIAALLSAADEVINADGLRRHNAKSFFGLLQRELTGVH